MAPNRTRLSIADKYSVITELRKGIKSTVIEKRLNISSSLVSVIKNNQEAIAREFEAGHVSKRKSSKMCNFPEVDKMLLDWFKQASAANVEGLTGFLLQQQAIKLARKANIADFDEKNWTLIGSIASRADMELA